MKKKNIVIASLFAMVFAIAIGFGFVPSLEQSASCAECESNNLPSIKKAFEAFDAECKKQLTAGQDQKKGCFTSNIYNKVLPVMKALAKDNRFGPGDRILLVGETQNGNLVMGADRGFQTLAPTDKDSITVELNKLDGGNGAIIKICTVDENGVMKRVGTLNFEEKNEAVVKKVTVAGTQGKIVRIDVASTGSALRKFKYALKTS